MTPGALLRRNLQYFWRPNLAVVAGVAIAVAVLGGALLVGASVRSSLQRIALERIGNTDAVIASRLLFREQLANALGKAVPMLALEGLITHQNSGRRATAIQIYGVDDRFFKFHGRPSPGLTARQAALSTALAAELGAAPGDTLLLRLEKPTDIPAESLFGRKDDAAPTTRLTLKSVLTTDQMGEFSLRPTQGSVRAVFVPLKLLQRDLNAESRVNTILLADPASAPDQLVRSAYTLEDLGLRVRVMEDHDALQIDTVAGVISDPLAQIALKTANETNLTVTTLFTYLSSDLAIGDRHVPYSLIAAVDLKALFPGVPDDKLPDLPEDAVVLNDWTARELAAKPGDKLTMEYMVWQPDNRIAMQKSDFTVARVIPMKGLAADRDLTPDYPGVTDADNLSDWDPPFPMDLNKIRPQDEAYWHTYRTTPKVFLQLKRAQQLWKSRWGSITTIRMRPANTENPDALQRALFGYRQRLRASLDPLQHGITVIPIRSQNLAASRGATDFGEYFTYFSFFLMVSALLLAGLFFRLGLEQRFGEVGLLRALGFGPGRLRSIYLSEGAILATVGGIIGVLGAIGYAALVVTGLTTFWIDAVGTRNLSLDIAAVPLLGGFFGGVIAALLAILLTLRGIRNVTPRGLLASGGAAITRTRAPLIAAISGALGIALLAAGAAKAIPAEAGFFGAGSLLLIAALAWMRGLLVKRTTQVSTLNKFAVRNAGFRPGRTILSTALIASATFLVVSVESFRRDPHAAATDPKSGTGGFTLIAESVRPLYYNPDTAKGREELPPDLPASTKLIGFRLRPGDDASCLNLYEPQNPRILGVPATFADQKRFTFGETHKKVDNPWSLLTEVWTDGSIPAIADANSIQYVLHKKVGDVIDLPTGAKLRLVAALFDSVFQSELLIGEENFQRLFPREQGYRVFLIDTPAAGADKITATLESALADRGFDAMPTADRLATFHRVENTYLSTFQTLGALGLLLGTIGLAAVLFRNVLERRRDLALLTAVGYTHRDLSKLILLENIGMLIAGIGVGVLTATLAIAPVLFSRGLQFSFLSIGILLAAVFLTGLIAAWLSTRAALRLRLLDSLRAA